LAQYRVKLLIGLVAIYCFRNIAINCFTAAAADLVVPEQLSCHCTSKEYELKLESAYRAALKNNGSQSKQVAVSLERLAYIFGRRADYARTDSLLKQAKAIYQRDNDAAIARIYIAL